VLFEEELDLLVRLRGEGAVTWSGATRAALQRQRVHPTTASGQLPVWVGVGGSPGSVVRCPPRPADDARRHRRRPAAVCPLRRPVPVDDRASPARRAPGRDPLRWLRRRDGRRSTRPPLPVLRSRRRSPGPCSPWGRSASTSSTARDSCPTRPCSPPSSCTGPTSSPASASSSPPRTSRRALRCGGDGPGWIRPAAPSVQAAALSRAARLAACSAASAWAVARDCSAIPMRSDIAGTTAARVSSAAMTRTLMPKLSPKMRCR